MSVRSRIWMLFLLITSVTACDALVKGGESAVLGGGFTFSGSETPNAAFVLPEGSLTVGDAQLVGRGKVIDTQPQGAFPSPGAAIVATGGVVRIRSGWVAGGSVDIKLGDSIAPAPPPVSPSLAGLLAPGLLAAGSVVDISGGTVESSSGSSASGVVPYRASPAVVAVSSTVQISGGTFRIGRFQLPFATAVFNPDPVSLITPVLDASRSTVEISGGNFRGPVRITSSQTRISGGSFPAGVVLGRAAPNVVPSGPGCTEIRGPGSFGASSNVSVDVRGAGEKVFVFGQDFDRPFGPLAIAASGPEQSFFVTGTLLDGSPLSVLLRADAGTSIVLVPADSPGCAPD